MLNFDDHARLDGYSNVGFILENGVVQTLSNSFYVALEINGFNLFNADSKEISDMFTHIENMIISSNGKFSYCLHSTRTINEENIFNEHGDISSTYENSIGTTYINRYYLIVRILFSEEKKLFNRLGLLKLINRKTLTNSLNQEGKLKTNLLREVNIILEGFKETLGLEQLKGLELEQFLGKLFYNNRDYLKPDDFVEIKGREKVGYFKGVNSITSNSDINFSDADACINYVNSNEFSRIYYIRFNEVVGSQLLHDILTSGFHVRTDINIKPIDKDRSAIYIDNAIKNKEYFESSGTALDGTDIDLMGDIRTSILADELILGDISTVVEIFVPNMKDLSKADNFIFSIGQKLGCKINYISDQRVPYLSRLPENDFLSGFKEILTSKNITNLFYCYKSSRGLEKVFWGEHLTKFKTLSGDIFRFNFHHDTKQNSLAHTFVIGSSSTGKTTLISFILACFMEKIKDAKVVCFDKLNGLKTFTTAMKGNYFDFNDIKSISFAPFLEFDLEADTFFFVSFIGALANKKLTQTEEAGIIEGLKILNSYVDETKNLDSFIEILNVNSDLTDLVEQLSVWRDKGYGFFNSMRILDYDSPLSTFDFTSILDNSKVFVPLILYLIYKIKSEQIKRKGKPLIIFIDEFAGYMVSSRFASFFNEIAREIRKAGGVLICATQSPKDLNDKAINASLTNFANYLIFPDKASDFADYSPSAVNDKASLLLNESDMNIISDLFRQSEHDKSRYVFFKSPLVTEVLNVDLSKSPTLLEQFNSNIS